MDKKVDYIVVGLGIAGICLCEQLERYGKNYIAIDNNQKGATAKSGGVLNPTVLKRFSAAWNTSEFYPAAIYFYAELSKKLNHNIIRELSILRIFKSVEEQNNWFVASDKRELNQFLSSNLIENKNPNILASYGFGEVLGTAKIDTSLFLNEYSNYLLSKDRLLVEQFDYNKFEVATSAVTYKGISAEKIIFCDGTGAMSNPYFPSSAIVPNKGEYLIIKAPELNLNVFLKGPLYVIPLGDSLYKVGATFGQGDTSMEPTIKAREEIISKLKTMISCSFEIVDHTVGIRPTTRDRKPLLGSLAENPNVYFLNGLGSRGFTMAPLLSEILFKNISSGIPIPAEMDIKRTS